MKQKLLLLGLLLISAFTASAQSMMVLHQKSGDDVSVLFSEKPVATYEGSELVITTESTTLRFTLSDINYLDFAESSTPVESVTILSQEAGPSKVYDTNGRLIKTIPAGEAVQTSALPQGLYIIKNNKITYKIRKQ